MPSTKPKKGAGKATPKAKPEEALPARPQISTAGLDAMLRALRIQWKQELAGIMEAAANRRKRANPAQMQSIILWEMDRIRHAEVKFKSERDKLLKGLPPEKKAEEKPPLLKIQATDKRPSHKEARLRVAE